MIDWQELKDILDRDPEFRHTIRHWTATLRFSIGDTHHLLRVEDGTVVELSACTAQAPCNVFVSGPESDWRELLRPVPRPFYQDVLFASVHHGFELSPEAHDYAAYYPAIRRFVEVLRESATDCAAEAH